MCAAQYLGQRFFRHINNFFEIFAIFKDCFEKIEERSQAGDAPQK
jgi:hypothetical protein